MVHQKQKNRFKFIISNPKNPLGIRFRKIGLTEKYMAQRVNTVEKYKCLIFLHCTLFEQNEKYSVGKRMF